MYGSHHQPPPPFYQSPSPAPPQPEWQQPPPAQHAPSWQGPEHMAPTPPAPPAPPGAGAYNPNIYGPMSGTPSSAVDPHPPTGFHSPTVDTSQWGVRYNQKQSTPHQHHPSFQAQAPPPPLPPRPGSGVGHSQTPSTAAPPSGWPTGPPPNQQIYAPSQPPTTGEQQQTWPTAPPPDQQMYPPSHPTGDQQQAWPSQGYYDPGFPGNQQIPPPPPPVPPVYQAEIQQQAQNWTQQPTYSDQPPTHHYDPPQQPPHQRPLSVAGPSPPPFPYSSPNNISNVAAPNAPPAPIHDHLQTPPPAGLPHPPPATGQQQTSPYVSPPAPAPAVPTVPTTTAPPPAPSASALGSGGPSDWEHLGAPSEDIDDTSAFTFKQQEHPQQPNTFELPSNHSPAVSRPDSRQFQRESVPTSQPQGNIVESTRPPSIPPTQIASPQDQTPSYPQQPTRNDSVDSPISPTGSSNIDGVIQMWSQPITSEANAKADVPPLNAAAKADPSKAPEQARIATPVSSHVQTPSHQSPRSTVSRTEPAPQTVVKIVDPYEDFDPWYKSSLTRYVTMLRKEMAAESDEERFKIFSHYLSKETKLREILYGVENTSNTANEPQSKPQARPQSLIHVDTNVATPTTSEADDVVNYSPGGRPILASALASGNPSLQKTGEGLHRSASHPTAPLQIRNKQAMGSDHEKPTTLSPPPDSALPRSTSVPLGSSFTAVPAPYTNPARPVYTPFRYTEGPQRGSDQLAVHQPAYQAYSALRQAGVDSGRTMAQPAIPPRSPSSLDAPSTARGEHDETFLGVIREKSLAYRDKRPGSTKPPPLPVGSLLPGAATAVFDELRSLIPAPLPNSAGTNQSIGWRRELDSFNDDFDFIDKIFRDWDHEASDRRSKLEKQRGVRQEESESHIDGLFNDKEIGYSDIGVLESEFKQTEAQKQLTEERREFERYVKNVFEPIDEALNRQISQLKAQYERALDFLNSETTVGGLIPGSTEKFQLSHSMKIAVDAFQKLEVRYQKQLDASLERDRRRRTAERRYYAFLGDTTSLKQLEKDFETAERRNMLEAAKNRDERANKLMDSFDDASMRGLGENQRLLDDMFAKVKKLDPITIKKMGKLPPSTEQAMNSASAFVQFLGGDSESILHSFGIADRLLNDADYVVSVSEAKVANAKPDIFRRLEEEKNKEDHKIEEDLKSRMESVRKGHQAILANMQEVLVAMRNAGFMSPGAEGFDNIQSSTTSPPPPMSGSDSPPPAPPPKDTPDAQQQERLRKALEDAKRRNAAKNVP